MTDERRGGLGTMRERMTRVCKRAMERLRGRCRHGVTRGAWCCDCEGMEPF